MPSQAVLDLLVRLKDEATKGFGTIADAAGNLGLVAGGVAVAGVVALGAAVVKGVGDAREAAQLLAQTTATITSTGGAAERSAEQITDLATALSASAGASLFGDSDVQMAENLLLTFTNIKGAVFDAATAISVDMAQALGGEPKDQAIALGKALNDPIAGVTALSRVGVTFTEQQKEQIKVMQEAGDTAGAQQVILAELNKEFGGSAAAAAAADGGWAQFNDRMGEAGEQVGAALLPLLGMLSGFLLDTIVPAVESAAAAFSAWLADPAVQEGIQQIGDAITTGLGVAFAFISETAIPALLGAWAAIQPAIAAVLPLFSGELPASLGQAGETFTLLGEIVTTAMTLIRAIISQVLPAITAFWNEHGAQIMQIAKAAFDYVVSVINVALTLIKGIITVALAAINGDWAGAWDALQQMSAQVVLKIGDAIKAFLNLIASFFDTSLADILQTWRDNWNRLVSIVTSINWLQLGSDVVGGIVQGVKGAAGSLMSTLKDLAGSALAAAKNALGISSPSQDFADDVGVPIVMGIMQGMTTTLPALGSLIKDTATAMVTSMHATITGGADTLAEAFQGITDQATEVTDDITGVFQGGDIGDALAQLGADALAGFGQGMIDGLDSVLDIINSTADTVEEAFNDAFDSHSPSQRMMPAGLFVMQGFIEGFSRGWPAMESVISEFGDKMIDKATQVANAAQRALSDAFGATANIDRQMAENIDKLSEIQSDFLRTNLEQSLAAYQKTAEAFADPKVGAQYFKMMSDQLFETQDIRDQITEMQARRQKELSEATTDEERARITALMQADKERLDAQLILISRAQEAELLAFQAAQQGATSPLQAIAANIQAIIQGMSGVSLGEAQYQVYTQLLALYDQLMNASRRALGGPVSAGQPYWVGERGPELFMPQQSGAIVPNGAAGGLTINNVFHLPPGTPEQLVEKVIQKMNAQMKGRRP